MDNYEGIRINRVFQKVKHSYMTADEISKLAYANDYDPRLVNLRIFRTTYHLGKLIEQGKVEKTTQGSITLYRRKR